MLELEDVEVLGVDLDRSEMFFENAEKSWVPCLNPTQFKTPPPCGTSAALPAWDVRFQACAACADGRFKSWEPLGAPEPLGLADTFDTLSAWAS